MYPSPMVVFGRRCVQEGRLACCLVCRRAVIVIGWLWRIDQAEKVCLCKMREKTLKSARGMEVIL